MKTLVNLLSSLGALPLRLTALKTATLTVLGASVALAIACADQGEGARCEAANGDEDCQSGLVCFPSAQLKDTLSDRCCPADRTRASADVCKIAVSITGVDASAPVDSGPPPAAVSDAAVDASSDGDAN